MKKVDLTSWAAIAKIIGTVAVVASLVFVGYSVQQNTSALQAENDNALYLLVDEWWRDFVHAPELQLYFDKQYRGEPLSELEYGVVAAHIVRLLNQFELAYARQREGLLPSYQWEMNIRAYTELLSYYVPKEEWDTNKSGFATDFVLFVDGIYEEMQ